MSYRIVLFQFQVIHRSLLCQTIQLFHLKKKKEYTWLIVRSGLFLERNVCCCFYIFFFYLHQYLSMHLKNISFLTKKESSPPVGSRLKISIKKRAELRLIYTDSVFVSYIYTESHTLSIKSAHLNSRAPEPNIILFK